ncbi:hypothetical protein CAL29_25365 [Bordetella genomosp. 10]|uniref:Hydantoinase B/oxoprolinase domain-containing protein n=1 Tax=Bordetella genomosp. 10 TaxID=1416804 RepID=A0A261S2Q1_9BORD|nr:hydantoinase B/oxoprolinase family protein [Bordetella genomosp. 10]OZI31257.1 hypothetical protein CAL29_25365 [Bordetella genomosp. 10]
MKIDPIKRELLKNALVTIADNALVMVVRTARSANVKNSMDFSAAICDGQGRLVAQGMAVPVHLGAIMPALKGCLDYFGDDIQPGDVLASNDPYSGCSHLNDIFTFKPVYANGRRIAFVGLILHHTDLGGRVPGGNAADSNEIFEEGLRIPPVKLVEAGRPSRPMLRMIEFNSRVPERVLGDLKAQLAALDQAEKELQKLLGAWEIDAFDGYMSNLIDYAEELTRSSIAALPDGEVEFEEWNDDDGVHEGPFKIHLKLTKRGEEIVCDFSQSPPQQGGAVHSNYVFTASCAYAAIRTLIGETVPNNAGLYRPIRVIAPEGSIVSARFPAAVGSRGQIGFRIRSIVLGALGKLTGGRMPACPGGSEFAIAASGYGADGRRFLHLEFHNTTGNGGGPLRDGQDAGPNCISNLANVPVELIEAENPIRVEEYAFLADTGGAGKYRGALGIARQYRFLSSDVVVQVRSDRFKSRPWGMNGGGEGAAARAWLNPGTRGEAALPSKFIRVMQENDVFRAEMAGSGGYGDPAERDPVAVMEDVMQGKITPAHAREAYGVVINADGSLDLSGTRALRQDRARLPEGQAA